MMYNGKELTEYKSDTPQFWPDGKEMLVWDDDESPRARKVFMYHPGVIFKFVIMSDRLFDVLAHAAEIPATTKRRVKRCECAGMAVKDDNGLWMANYNADLTEKEWNEPMSEYHIDRALTLADALAGRTLGMEVEE